MTLPKTYRPNEAPTHVLALVSQLMPLLLEGEHPVLATLRGQYQCAQIKEVELTGSGFFVEFEVPPDAPMVDPPHFSGGDANIELAGAPHGAGCVLHIRGGHLSMLEGYTYGDEWSEDAKVLAVSDVFPIRHSLPS